MALIACRECGNKISKTAESCPQCGAPNKKKRKPYGCGTLILVLVVGGYIAAQFTPDHTPSPASAKVDEAPPNETPAEREARIRNEKIQNSFSSLNGRHLALSYRIKESLKDPDSFEHIETVYSDDGDLLTVRTRYRAKNSFGGYVIEEVVARTRPSGEIVEIVSQQAL